MVRLRTIKEQCQNHKWQMQPYFVNMPRRQTFKVNVYGGLKKAEMSYLAL